MKAPSAIRSLVSFTAILVAAGAALIVGPGTAEAATISPVLSFPSHLSPNAMGMTFDGTHYWAVSGGSASTAQEGEYTAAGTLVSSFSPGIDFRSITIDGSGTLYARAFRSNTILKQTAPGVFSAYATLSGGQIDEEASLVVSSAAGGGFLSAHDGVIDTWDMSGHHTGLVTLQGYGSQAGEGVSPDNVHVASLDGFFLTYNHKSATVSVWDADGNRVSTFALAGGPTNFISGYSFSAANDQIYLSTPSGTWKAYPFGTITSTPSASVPAGHTVRDQATVVGQSPTGTVSFALYPPSDPTCSGTPLGTKLAHLSNETAGSAAIKVTVAGTYQWIATYEGDKNNPPVTTACGDEPVVVTPAALKQLVLSPATAQIAAGASQAYTAEGFDQYGNDRGPVAGVTYSISGGGSCTGHTCKGPAGTHTITGRKGAVSGSATLTIAAKD